MRKWLRKYIKYLPDSKEISQKSKQIVNDKLGHVKLLRNPILWRFNRQTIAKGIAAGLFAAMIPIMPFQTVIAALVAIILKGNIPVALIASWLSNPITLVPISYFTYYIGDLIMGNNETARNVVNYSWQYETSMWLSLKAWLVQFGQGFFIGLPIIAISAGLLGYLGVLSVYFLIDLIKSKYKNIRKKS